MNIRPVTISVGLSQQAIGRASRNNTNIMSLLNSPAHLEKLQQLDVTKINKV